jgi:hypothetical protein
MVNNIMGTITDKKEFTQKIDRLWALWNGMRIEFEAMARDISIAQVVNIHTQAGAMRYFEKAQEELTSIEDAIRRYRNNLPQTYEE